MVKCFQYVFVDFKKVYNVYISARTCLCASVLFTNILVSLIFPAIENILFLQLFKILTEIVGDNNAVY